MLIENTASLLPRLLASAHKWAEAAITETWSGKPSAEFGDERRWGVGYYAVVKKESGCLLPERTAS